MSTNKFSYESTETLLKRYPVIEPPHRKVRKWDERTLSGFLGVFCIVTGFGLLKNIEVISLTYVQLGLIRTLIPELWGFSLLVTAGFLFRDLSATKLVFLVISMVLWGTVTASILIVRPLEPYLAFYLCLGVLFLNAMAFQRTFSIWWEIRLTRDGK